MIVHPNTFNFVIALTLIAMPDNLSYPIPLKWFFKPVIVTITCPDEPDIHLAFQQSNMAVGLQHWAGKNNYGLVYDSETEAHVNCRTKAFRDWVVAKLKRNEWAKEIDENGNYVPRDTPPRKIEMPPTPPKDELMAMGLLVRRSWNDPPPPKKTHQD